MPKMVADQAGFCALSKLDTKRIAEPSLVVTLMGIPAGWSPPCGAVTDTDDGLAMSVAEVVTEDIPAWLERTKLPAHAYVVIVTRGHTNDLDALRALAPRDLRYVGLIGSRAKVARISDQLLSEGMPGEVLKQVHAPIGLDIGAVTPQEIAVSILAELIAVKHGKIKSRDAAELSMKWSKIKT